MNSTLERGSMSTRKTKIQVVRSLTAGALVLGLIVGSTTVQAEWFDESAIRGYDDFTGPYARFGIAIGQVNLDEDEVGDALDVVDGNLDSDVSAGFTMAGGYRIFPWLAVDANFVFLTGKDNIEASADGNSFEGDLQSFVFTFGPKVFPLALVDLDAVPHYVQPYVSIGIGGGEVEADFGGGFDTKKDGFAARFIVGFDVWATDNVGFYFEGGGFLIDSKFIEGAGEFGFGGQYRF
jgi:opacity protein-like surface antigen